MAPRKKYTSTDKFIDRLAKAQGYWKCTKCGQWHPNGLKLCPLYFMTRSECEDKSKEVK